MKNLDDWTPLDWHITPAKSSNDIRYLTYEVAASAYSAAAWAKVEQEGAHILTHAVNVDTNRPVCSSIKRSSLLEDGGLITANEPTCPACRRRLKLICLQ